MRRSGAEAACVVRAMAGTQFRAEREVPVGFTGMHRDVLGSPGAELAQRAAAAGLQSTR